MSAVSAEKVVGRHAVASGDSSSPSRPVRRPGGTCCPHASQTNDALTSQAQLDIARARRATKERRMKFLKRLLLRGSGGNGRAVLHSDLRDARLRRPLLDAGPLRDEASASRRERGHHVDGRVRRLQLRPAPLRRLPGRPLPFEPQPVRRRHGAAGVRLRAASRPARSRCSTSASRFSSPAAASTSPAST